jgi:hypothetical protein
MESKLGVGSILWPQAPLLSVIERKFFPFFPRSTLKGVSEPAVADAAVNWKSDAALA